MRVKLLVEVGIVGTEFLPRPTLHKIGYQIQPKLMQLIRLLQVQVHRKLFLHQFVDHVKHHFGVRLV
jgi:hypothetical protein